MFSFELLTAGVEMAIPLHVFETDAFLSMNRFKVTLMCQKVAVIQISWQNVQLEVNQSSVAANKSEESVANDQSQA